LVLVYRIDLLPDTKRTAVVWRERCAQEGIGDIYLVSVESFGGFHDPAKFGFDAAVEFPPHAMGVTARRPGTMLNDAFRGTFYDYTATARRFRDRELPDFTLFRSVMPSWDNTARRQNDGHIFLGAAPEEYEQWLRAMVRETMKLKAGDERIVFVNAWNEWAEGNYLEPDRRYGRQYLEATKRALDAECAPGGVVGPRSGRFSGN